MLPPPPRSTLFPYTTLFRSHLRVQRQLPPGGYPAGLGVGQQQAERQARVRLGAGVDVEGPLPPDRKSTRLNSSHRCISYAVFCLKKKKKKKNKISRIRSVVQ